MEKVLGMIGLAKRAGALQTGLFLCENAIKNRSAKLVIIASDISEKSAKSIMDSCAYYKIPHIMFSDMTNLGKFTGGGEKAAVAVTDSEFAKAIGNKIETVIRKDR